VYSFLYVFVALRDYTDTETKLISPGVSRAFRTTPKCAGPDLDVGVRENIEDVS